MYLIFWIEMGLNPGMQRVGGGEVGSRAYEIASSRGHDVSIGLIIFSCATLQHAQSRYSSSVNVSNRAIQVKMYFLPYRRINQINKPIIFPARNGEVPVSDLRAVALRVPQSSRFQVYVCV